MFKRPRDESLASEYFRQPNHQNRWLIALGALGVVFGDIGTSPLYAFRECFSPHYGVPLSEANILGILALIFWSLMIIISLKYMSIVMRADNKGEGGILSLMALATGGGQEAGARRKFALVLGIFGAALLFGDGIITPAISVLSAVEGLNVVTPGMSAFIVPITVSIIAVLFLFQRWGTGRIGAVFGPIILVWFFVIGFFGLIQIIKLPHVLLATYPLYAIRFFIDNTHLGVLVLGSVFLVVTGGEALYADMGHFGKRPIQLAWFYVAMPGLILNYFGQGALLLSQPEAISNPFYLLAPESARAGLVALSTVATVIASQALISGVFSITRQAVQLGYWPRVSIVHTSSREMGQIYIPFINWALMAGVIWLVVDFASSSRLAGAYGVAVTLTMVITTILAYEVARHQWNWPRWVAALVFLFFLAIDLAFAGANLIKLESGGWIPLTIGAAIYLLMTTWRKGRKILAQSLKERSIPLDQFLERIANEKPIRVAGAAIYMSSDPWGVPIPLLHNLKHNKVLHQTNALLTIKTQDVPFVSKKERVSIEQIADGFYRIFAYYGFMETPKIKHILEGCREKGIPLYLQESTFVLGRETIIPSSRPGMSIWREKIFAIMSKNAERPTTFFRIPPNQVIEVGIQVEI